MTRHSVIVVSGLPGSGKSTLAEALATEFAAALLSKDVIEAALWRRGVGRDQDSFWISQEIITTLARDAARRGQPVIIDTVATTEDVRRDWRDLARGARCAIALSQRQRASPTSSILNTTPWVARRQEASTAIA